MFIKITGTPNLTISGSNYSADIPLTAYDDRGWPITSISVTVTGALTDTAPTFMTKLRTESDAWKTALAIKDAMMLKLAGLEGKTL